jgi:hypothetical protein
MLPDVCDPDTGCHVVVDFFDWKDCPNEVVPPPNLFIVTFLG